MNGAKAKAGEAEPDARAQAGQNQIVVDGEMFTILKSKGEETARRQAFRKSAPTA